MKNGKHVILYIDDDQDCLDAVRIILEANGYEMVEARSAEEGLRAYKKSNPDCLIVDLMMEEIDAGTSFVRELQILGNKAPTGLGPTLWGFKVWSSNRKERFIIFTLIAGV